MKYTKKLQILLELASIPTIYKDKSNNIIVSIDKSKFQIDVTDNKLLITPYLVEAADSSLYEIELNNININDDRNIDNILKKIAEQALRLNSSEDRKKNIKIIQNDETFKEKLKKALKNLIENAKNLKQAA